MNGIGERERETETETETETERDREKTRETSLDRAKSVFYFLTTGFIPFHRTCFQGTRCLFMITQD